MSAKNCLVVVYKTPEDRFPNVIPENPAKTGLFSKKEAQRQATDCRQRQGCYKAVVVESVMEVL